MGDRRVPRKAPAECRAVCRARRSPGASPKNGRRRRGGRALGSIWPETVNPLMGDIGAKRRRVSCGFAYSCRRPAQPAKQGRWRVQGGDVMALHREIRQQMSCSLLHRNVFLHSGCGEGGSERRQSEKRGRRALFNLKCIMYVKIIKILQ